jgi:hypothetical protein
VAKVQGQDGDGAIGRAGKTPTPDDTGAAHVSETGT